MNIAVIGLGSMGKRRIRIIKELKPEYSVVGIDSREDRRDEVAKQFGVLCFEDLDNVNIRLDCVFICTSPLSHNEIIREALERGLHVFSEINLVSDGYDANMRVAKEKNLILFLSSTFFYREEIRYIKKSVTGCNWNYIYHIGQYLPDWHPWENYKDLFLGDKRTNGCREILAIELPWLIGTFGNVEKYDVVSDKMSTLHVDYKDNFMIQLIHRNGNKGILVVDVVSPVAVRKLEVYKENQYMTWGGTPETLFEYDDDTKSLRQVVLSEKAEHVQGYRAFVVENAYKNEIVEFFDVVLHGKKALYSFKQDKEILQLIDSLGA